MANKFERNDRVRYKGVAGTVRCVTHWAHPASLHVRLDDGRLVYALEIHFEKIGALAGVADGPAEIKFEVEA